MPGDSQYSVQTVSDAIHPWCRKHEVLRERLGPMISPSYLRDLLNGLVRSNINGFDIQIKNLTELHRESKLSMTSCPPSSE